MLMMMPYVGFIIASSGAELISNMGLDALYHASYVSPTSADTCVVTFTVKNDGSWTITKNQGLADWVSGTTFSGNWISPTSAGIGNDYEVSFNNGSSYQALTSDRSVNATANDTTVNNGSVIVNNNNTVIVRKVGTSSPTSSDSFALRAEDDYSTV